MGMNDVTHLTVEQLADRWNLHKHTLYNWRYKNRGPAFVKIGAKVLYRLDVIEQYERDHMTVRG